MQRHVHRADTQHRGVKVEAVEQAFVEMPPQLVVLKQRGVMLAQIFADRVPLHLEHGDVVLVRLEKQPSLAAEGVHVRADCNAWNGDVGCSAPALSSKSE
jgi:hypothetical protein